MKKPLSLIFVLASIAFISGASISAQTKCFINIGLKDTDTAKFTITGSKVSGWYTHKPESYDADKTENFEFSGTRSGNNITVKFAGNKPVWMPKGNSWLWQLVQTSGGESLRMKIYGQNYETKKYSVYSVDFDSCYKTSSRDATRISFARGTDSTKMTIAPDATESVYVLGVKKGQFIGAIAHGYTVEIYFPNGDVYGFAEGGNEGGEKNQTENMDMLSADDPVPQSGDALIILRRMTELSKPQMATFFVTNTQKELNKKFEQIGQ